MQGQSLTGVEADPDPPLLPRDLMAGDGEARPVGLGDLDRSEIVARRAGVLRGVVARLGRERGDAGVLELDELHRVQIDDRDQPLDRTRVAVVARLRAHPGQRPAQPPVVAQRPARRPRVDHQQAGIGDAASGQRREELGVGLEHLLAFDELLEHHPWLHARDERHRGHRLIGERDDRLVNLAAGAIHQDDERLPRHRRVVRVRVPGEHVGLGRLVQLDGREADAVGQLALLAQDRHRLDDLVGGERLQRVAVDARRLIGGSERGVGHRESSPGDGVIRRAAAARPGRARRTRGGRCCRTAGGRRRGSRGRSRSRPGTSPGPPTGCT